MPFSGQISPGEQEKIVLPEQIEDGREVVCPVCGGTMRPRDPFDDGRARCFYHVTADSKPSMAIALEESQIRIER